ncbi:hypothetical protein [Clostridium sp.]|uniref:hypothetical protein n=1 Tax=Clostridium sp. TaxID=1506 RepID=UPI001DB1B0B9|nr:hypothetical protein [Clostridium sp.]MBS5985724.1 hypothetical protein [Clostridium sp.]
MWRTTDINKIVNKYEVKKVYGGKRPSKIRDDGGEGKNKSFKEALKEQKKDSSKEEIIVQAKEELEESVIVSSSLRSLIQKNNVLDRIIEEEIQNHPNLNNLVEDLYKEEK